MRLSSSSLVMESARTSCSERSAKRFTGAPVLFRTTIKNGCGLAMRKKKCPEGRRGTASSGSEACRPQCLAVRHRRERGRDVRVTQVYRGAPNESPLAIEEINEKGKHGSHR